MFFVLFCFFYVRNISLLCRREVLENILGVLQKHVLFVDGLYVISLNYARQLL